MKTKKLVLGFCALAAVAVSADQRAIATGAAPQVLGSPDQMGGAVPARAAMPARRLTAKQDLRQRIATEDAKLARMGRREVDCVTSAFWHDHYAFFLLGISLSELEAACERVNIIERKLAIAEKRAQRAWFSFTEKRANAIVDALQLELTEAKEARYRMSESYSEQYIEINNCISVAQKLRDAAIGWREQRLAYFTELVNASPIEIGDGDTRVTETYDMKIMHTAFRCIAEKAIAASITDVIRSHTDDRWPRYIVDGYRELCCESQKMYWHEVLRYDHHTDLSSFDEQMVRLLKQSVTE
ncbi:MAG: hypothetical protein LBL18_06335 [Bacteroidales bacterium]|jgi:hypothetical protein|nr:hypothetical protein [Bacteroidales bacterium]